MADPNQKKNTNVLSVIFSVAILVAAAILYIIFRPSRLLQLYDRPIPYIFELHYHNGLQKYVDEEEHKEILLVYGPHGIGKTRGLFEFSKELQQSGRLVIDLDFHMLSQYSTTADLVNYLSHSVITAFQALDGTPYKQSLLKQALSKVTASSSFIVKDPVGKMHFFGFTKDHLLQKAASYIVSAIESPDKPANVKAIALFDAIESLKDALRPVIIVHEPWKLLQTEGCKDYCVETTEFFGRLFNGYGEKSFSTSIIFDVANQTKIPLFKREPFRFIRPYEFDPEVAQHMFVSKEKIFTTPQFKGLFNVFGGCGIYFAQAHELLATGYQFVEVMDILKRDLKASILRQIKIAPNPKQMEQLLLSLVTGKPDNRPDMPSVNNSLTQQLLASGLFGYASPELDRVEFATPGIETALVELKKSKFNL